MAVSWWQPEVPVLQQQAAIVLLGLWDIPGDRSTPGKTAAQSNTEVLKDAWAAPSSNQRSTSSHLKICHSPSIIEIAHTVKQQCVHLSWALPMEWLALRRLPCRIQLGTILYSLALQGYNQLLCLLISAPLPDANPELSHYIFLSF